MIKTPDKQRYHLYPYAIKPIALSKENLKKMIRRIKANKLNRTYADDYEWSFKFKKNRFLFRHKKLKAMLISAPLEKDKDGFIIRHIWAHPGVDNYFKFEFMLEATSFEEKLAEFLEMALKLFLRKIKPPYSIDHPKRLKRTKVDVRLEYSTEDFDKIKTTVASDTYDSYGWGYLFRDSWFCIFHVGMGFFIKAQFKKENDKIIIRKVFIWPQIQKFLAGEHAVKESLDETAKRIISVHIEGLIFDWNKQNQS